MHRPSILLSIALFGLLVSACVKQVSAAESASLPRPNILWLTSEDNGPELGCYGDSYADSPNIDRLAERGMIYLNAWSNAPVCAPARTTIISGMYAPSAGAQHMRSFVSLPTDFRMFPQYLREVGYYCTNNVKEDYNLRKPGQVWDDSSREAHWKNRKPGQPFFSVFNITVSHESRIRTRPHQQIHDPAQAPIPPYHPDHPDVRRDWAQYYDKLTEMDTQIGERMKELEDAGLADDTIIFYYGDHGSGMPRSKRWLYQSGLRIPMIVHVPKKYQALAAKDYMTGGSSERLVGFVDLAPTVLSLAGVEVPEHFQGNAFMGPAETLPPRYMYGFRGRMDERIDMSRSVRDQRYLYIRNYMPHKPQGQFLEYMFQTPTTVAWKQLFDEGKLSPAQAYFWQQKAPEELYDISQDPYQIKNLVSSPEHAKILARMRDANRQHLFDTRDLGFMPEAEMLARSEDRSPYELGHDDSKYPIERILAVAEQASSLDVAATADLVDRLDDAEFAVRYWAAMGLLMRGKEAVTSARENLMELFDDPSPNVRIVAAEALGKYGQPEDLGRALATLIDLGNVSRHSAHVSIAALGALDDLDEKAAQATDRIKSLPTKPPRDTPRCSKYIARLLNSTLTELADSGE